MPKDKLKLISFNEEEQKLIDRLKIELCLRRDSDVIRNSVAYHHKKLFPDYIEMKRAVLPPIERTKSRLAAKEEYQAEKKQRDEETGKAFCVALEGELIPAGDGFMCRFKTFQKLGNRVMEGQLTLDTLELSEKDLERQYRDGTKEEIQNILNAV